MSDKNALTERNLEADIDRACGKDADLARRIGDILAMHRSDASATGDVFIPAQISWSAEDAGDHAGTLRLFKGGGQ